MRNAMSRATRTMFPPSSSQRSESRFKLSNVFEGPQPEAASLSTRVRFEGGWSSGIVVYVCARGEGKSGCVACYGVVNL